MSDEAYRTEIDRLINEMSGEIALNGSHEHASIIVERMFARAKRTVRIVSRSLDPRIYSVRDTMDSFKRFLGSGDRKCRVIVEDVDAANETHNEFLRMRHEYSNFDVRTVPARLKQPVDITFALMDMSGFRFEKDGTGTTAITAFGERKLTFALDQVFEKLWNVSEDMPRSMALA